MKFSFHQNQVTKFHVVCISLLFFSCQDDFTKCLDSCTDIGVKEFNIGSIIVDPYTMTDGEKNYTVSDSLDKSKFGLKISNSYYSIIVKRPPKLCCGYIERKSADTIKDMSLIAIDVTNKDTINAVPFFNVELENKEEINLADYIDQRLGSYEGVVYINLNSNDQFPNAVIFNIEVLLALGDTLRTKSDTIFLKPSHFNLNTLL